MTPHIHFFKAHSRLGLFNKPNKSEAVNTGVELGPDAILSHDFLRQLQSNYTLSHFIFSDPSQVAAEQYFKTLAQESASMRDQINAHLHTGETQVVVGGDHSVAFPSILALLDRLPARTSIGYVQFDSHGDLHRHATSPSGNFHGMWLRALTEGIGNKDIDELVTRRLDPHSMLFFGNLDLEQAEEDYFRDMRIDRWSEEQLLQDFSFVQRYVHSFVSKYDHVHISFDIDVFDRQFASATGTPAPNGLDPSHIFPLLTELSQAKSISVDLVEVNPQKAEPQMTIELGQRVIETILQI